ncbi:MAG: hypothetical protein WAM81_05015 [Acidimicrobiia bacterium]
MKRDTSYTLVAAVLRGGVALGGALLAIGLVMGIATGDVSTPALRLTDLFAGGSLDSRLELAGILLCSATPGAGVLALIGARLRGRDWGAAATAAVVVTILVVGMIIGHV